MKISNMNIVELSLTLETEFNTLFKSKIVSRDNFLNKFKDEILVGLTWWNENGFISENEKNDLFNACDFSSDDLSEIMKDSYNLSAIQYLVDFLHERTIKIKKG